MKPGIDYTGVSVGFYAHDGSGNFVFHKRSNKCRDEHGTWDCGGGKLEFGEDLKAGALRELKEEYGCDGIIEKELPAHSHTREHNRVKTHWVVIQYIIRVDRGSVVIGEPEYMDEIGWFKINALPQPLHTGCKKEIETFKEELNKV